MAILGGFLGGGVEMVPAGYGQLVMQWSPSDDENRKVSFSIVGPGGTSTVESNESGYAEKIVPVGRYVVSVSHQGAYANDGPKTVDVESAKSYLVYFGATVGDVSTLRITFENSSYLNQTYEVKDSKGLTKYSGALKTYETDLLVGFDTYNLILSSGIDFNVTVDSPGVKTIKIEDYTSIIQIDDSSVPKGTTFEIDGEPVSGKSLVVNPGTHIISSISPRITTPDVAIANIEDISTSVQIGETSIVKPIGTGVVIQITSSQSATLYGRFSAFVMGGGGSGGGSANQQYRVGGGGGSGYFNTGIVTLSGQTSFTIGSGGSGAGYNSSGYSGGATSIGSYLSASGGAGGKAGSQSNVDGGSGEAGGGAGYIDGLGGKGGNGRYGGGGGGSAGFNNRNGGNGGNSVYGDGGNGAGSYGGSPGQGGSSQYGNAGTAGPVKRNVGGNGGVGKCPPECEAWGLNAVPVSGEYISNAGRGGYLFAISGSSAYNGGGGGAGGYGVGGASDESRITTVAGIGAGGAGAGGKCSVSGAGGNGIILLKWVGN